MEIAIKDAVEKVNEHEPVEDVRDAGELAIGEGFRQGDVYMARVESINGKPVNRRQMVEGTSRGSRHVVEGDAQLVEPSAEAMPGWVSETALLLPSVKVGKEGATLTHPEHGHYKLPAGSSWVAWSQMDPRTMRRVVD